MSAPRPPKGRSLKARLTGTARTRWLVTLAGALALAGVAWFLAPLLVLAGHRPLDEAGSRLLLAAAILAAWGLANRRIDRRERAANERLVAALAGSSDPDARASLEEIGLLQDRLSEALERLRTMRFGARWGGRFVYQLPWYLVIGAPGSGKTTALTSASLGFPVDGRAQALPLAVGGTRHGDWWFTERAVLIDTAGRYTTQDSRHAVDSRVWAGLLELLKEHRPRQPINGVLITVSLADLASWTEAERRAHAFTIRQRLQELRRQLGVRFPVYVVCTKADLVTGFTGFFDTLTPEERCQVWGMTFPLGDGPNGLGPAGWFRDSFLALLRRLDERLLERLHQEPDVERRSLNFTFPLQMASLEAPLADLLETAFSPGPNDQPLLLRGVYFTSATQGGVAVDRLAAPFAGFGAGHPGGEDEHTAKQSFFLERLFRELVFAEANLAGVDEVLERARRRRSAVLIGGTLAAALALAVFWARSHAGNVELVSRVEAAGIQAAQALKALDTPPRSLGRVDDTDFAAVLPALDALRAIPTGYADQRPGAPLELGGGLYQGDRLGRLADGAYRRALRSIFLSRIVLRLEEQLRTNWARPDQLRLCLRAYLMLSGREPLDVAAVNEWMAADWQRTLPGTANEDRRRALGEHLAALFAVGFAPVPADDMLLERVREVLNQPVPRPQAPL
ncbi:MAG TPA: type VI secretion system membrane subunit TssM [Azospirillum sp.]|nr:type VI secretion system membrane subunit TssM [Azospirillum sp.]